MLAALRRDDASIALFAAALAGAGALLLIWLGDLTFWRDEWGFLLERRGWEPDVFLEPHYEHIAISLIASYKFVLALFGMDSPFPFQVVAVLAFLLSVALLFVYVRRRVGGWVALAATLPILVLGPAWDDLLWPFQLGFFASMSAGLGALLALERGDRAGDLLAAGLLVVAVSFSSLGLPFVAGVAVHVAWGRDRWRRAWVLAVPAAVYGLWWLGWGRDADTYASLHNLATSISYVLDGFASSLASLLGLASPRDEVLSTKLDWGRSLLVVAVALGAWRLLRTRHVSRPLCVALAIAVSFWFLAGLNASIFREPASGRYQYMGAVFVVLIGAELCRGVRPTRPVVVAVLAIAAIAALANLNGLREAHRSLVAFGQLQPAALAALELTRDQVDPDFELTEENSGVDYLGLMRAGSYLSAVEEFGSPAFTPAELAAAPEGARAAADRTFAGALEIGLEPIQSPAGDCRVAAPEPGVPAVVELEAGEAIVRASPAGAAELAVRRYASESFPVEAGSLAAGEGAVLAIPSDRSTHPWQLQVSGDATVGVCQRSGAAPG